MASLSTSIRLAVVLLRNYQRFVSPFLGNHCRFYPTCSQYSIVSICRFGLLKGVMLTLKRILKCHPLNPGGYDPVPLRIKDSREN